MPSRSLRCVSVDQQTIVRKRGIDRGQYLQAQLVLFKEVSKPKNGADIGHVVNGE